MCAFWFNNKNKASNKQTNSGKKLSKKIKSPSGNQPISGIIEYIDAFDVYLSIIYWDFHRTRWQLVVPWCMATNATMMVLPFCVRVCAHGTALLLSNKYFYYVCIHILLEREWMTCGYFLLNRYQWGLSSLMHTTRCMLNASILFGPGAQKFVRLAYGLRRRGQRRKWNM